MFLLIIGNSAWIKSHNNQQSARQLAPQLWLVLTLRENVC